MVLDLNEQIVFAENFLKTSRLDFGVFVIVLQERLQDMPTQTSGRRNETFVVLLKQLPVHSRLVVVTLKESQT